MKLTDALLAARANLNQVTGDDLDTIRKPLLEYRAKNPFVQFREMQWGDAFPFERESAHVITATARFEAKDIRDPGDEEFVGKPAAQLRHIKRGPGRDSISVKGIKLESRAPAPIHWLFDNDGSVGEGIERNLLDFLSRSTLEHVEHKVVWAMAGSARAQGRLVESTRASMREATVRAVEEQDGPCTVIANHGVLTALLPSPRFDYKVGSNGLVVPSRVIAENAAIVIPNDPDRNGFVRVQAEPEVFVVPNSTGEIECVAVCYYGFCIWGDAPLTWISAGPE